MRIFDIFKAPKTNFDRLLEEFGRQNALIAPVMFLAFTLTYSEIIVEKDEKKLIQVIYFYGTLDGLATLLDKKNELNDEVILGFLRGALYAESFGYKEEVVDLIKAFLVDNFNEEWFRKIHIQGVEAINRFWGTEAQSEEPNIFRALEVQKIFDDDDLLKEAKPHLEKQVKILQDR